MAFEYYADHGFQVGDHWRHEHDADSGGDNGWNGRDHHDNGGDHSGTWNGTDNGGNQVRGYNGGPNNGGSNSSGDWRTGGTNPPNYDQNRAPDNSGRNTGGPGEQRPANGNGVQPPAPMLNTIHVTTATYGATCHVPSGNVTKYLADACNGKAMCEYVVQFQTIGDPAPGCAKDFSVQWTCSAGPGGSAAAPAEAGLGSKVGLQCANAGH